MESEQEASCAYRISLMFVPFVVHHNGFRDVAKKFGRIVVNVKKHDTSV